ncbi:MAG: hypothetical protein ABW044_08785, partial [Cellvibrio sp.]
QMLIENGIKHGLDNIKQGGELSVVCSHDELNLYVEISNDIPQAPVSTPHNTGIGLKNIKHRLELLYNDKAELKTIKTSNKFTANLIIPKELAQ